MENFQNTYLKTLRDIKNNFYKIENRFNDICKNFGKNCQNLVELDILKKNIDVLHNLAKALLDYETITGDEMKEIIQTGCLSSPESEKKQKKRSRRTSKTDPES